MNADGTSLFLYWIIFPSRFSCLSSLVESTWPLGLLHAPKIAAQSDSTCMGLRCKSCGTPSQNMMTLLCCSKSCMNMFKCSNMAQQLSITKNYQGVCPHRRVKHCHSTVLRVFNEFPHLLHLQPTEFKLLQAALLQ
jgi:hypothetical protein